MRLTTDLVRDILNNDGFLKSFSLNSVTISEETVEISIDLTPNLLRVGDIMNGGATCTLMDFAGGLVVMNDQSIFNEVTTNLSVEFLNPVSKGPVIVQARVVKRGKTLVYVEIDLLDGDRKICSKGLGTWFVFR